MIIDREYVVNRAFQLIQEKQQNSLKRKSNNDKLFRIKQRFPVFLRKIIFHPYNPAYSVFLQSKTNQNQLQKIPSLHPYAVDMVKYFLDNDMVFDTSSYYPESNDTDIKSFIDYRLKSVINGFDSAPLSDIQRNALKEREQLLSLCTKKNDIQCLRKDSKSYYLPIGHQFHEHTYIHEYGLKYLPTEIKEYISGKIFLDIGSFIGDTSVMLEKNYNPSAIYAYEPVSANFEMLQKTIAINNTDKITPIQKGIGDQEISMDIFVDPENLSACSINENQAISEGLKEPIQISTIDNEYKDMPAVGLIKMDIEGAEYSAIKGGLNIIKRDKPVLLISVYHTAKDFYEIPPLLREAVPEYNFRFIDLDHVNPMIEKVIAVYPQL
ncbi:MAG: FkbM family methyltransferase [Dysgonomonas sp.]